MVALAPARRSWIPWEPVSIETPTPSHLELRETPEAFLATADVSGIDPAGIEITLSGQYLAIKATDRDTHIVGDGDARRELTSEARVERGAWLPGSVRAWRGTATVDGGLLRVTLPKDERPPVRFIRITTGPETLGADAPQPGPFRRAWRSLRRR